MRATHDTHELRTALQWVVLDYIRTAYVAARESGRPEPTITSRDVLEWLRQHMLDTRLTLTYTRRERAQVVRYVLRRMVTRGELETSIASGRTGAEVRAYNPTSTSTNTNATRLTQ
jgi:hypothetical protein